MNSYTAKELRAQAAHLRKRKFVHADTHRQYGKLRHMMLHTSLSAGGLGGAVKAAGGGLEEGDVDDVRGAVQGREHAEDPLRSSEGVCMRGVFECGHSLRTYVCDERVGVRACRACEQRHAPFSYTSRKKGGEGVGASWTSACVCVHVELARQGGRPSAAQVERSEERE